MMEQEEVLKIIRDLAATCRDAEEGFNKAAKGVHSDKFLVTLDRYSTERSQFAAELDEAIRQRGAAPGDTGHGSGPLRRGWRELEARIRPKNDWEMVLECADGEESGLKHYDHALTQELPEDIRRILTVQRQSIERAVEDLRASARANVG